MVLELAFDDVGNVGVELARELTQITFDGLVQHLLDLTQVVEALHESLMIEFAEGQLFRIVTEILNTLLNQILVMNEPDQLGNLLRKLARVLFDLLLLLFFFFGLLTEVNFDFGIAFALLLSAFLIVILDQLVKGKRIIKGSSPLLTDSSISGP